MTARRVATSDKYYEHTQNTPATVWSVTHNLGKRPSVTVEDSSGNVVIGAVQHDSANALQITFSSAFSGKAHCS